MKVLILVLLSILYLPRSRAQETTHQHEHPASTMQHDDSHTQPATVTHRFYPELFQQGETAFGRPITDGQHPHDFFMELALLYDIKLGNNALLSFYAAPVGDPAIGPAAYAHRSSASENPMAALGH